MKNTLVVLNILGSGEEELLILMTFLPRPDNPG
jgi:hypothetical protein